MDLKYGDRVLVRVSDGDVRRCIYIATSKATGRLIVCLEDDPLRAAFSVTPDAVEVEPQVLQEDGVAVDVADSERAIDDAAPDPEVAIWTYRSPVDQEDSGE